MMSRERELRGQAREKKGGEIEEKEGKHQTRAAQKWKDIEREEAEDGETESRIGKHSWKEERIQEWEMRNMEKKGG